jgi:hypothetical protein
MGSITRLFRLPHSSVQYDCISIICIYTACVNIHLLHTHQILHLMGKPIQAMCLSIGIVSLVALYLQQINMYTDNTL